LKTKRPSHRDRPPLLINWAKFGGILQFEDREQLRDDKPSSPREFQALKNAMAWRNGRRPSRFPVTIYEGTPRVGTRVVGLNMCRFLLYAALALYFTVPGAAAADRYGQWLLEQPEALYSRCYLNNRCHLPIKSQHQNSGLFAIKGTTQRMSR
jgi:hypothetical protein